MAGANGNKALTGVGVEAGAELGNFTIVPKFTIVLSDFGGGGLSGEVGKCFTCSNLEGFPYSIYE